MNKFEEVLLRYTNNNALTLINFLKEDVCIAYKNKYYECSTYMRFDDIAKLLSPSHLFTTTKEKKGSLMVLNDVDDEDVINFSQLNSYPMKCIKSERFELPRVKNIIYLVDPTLFIILNERDDIFTYDPNDNDNKVNIQGVNVFKINYLIGYNRDIENKHIRFIDDENHRKIKQKVSKLSPVE